MSRDPSTASSIRKVGIVLDSFVDLAGARDFMVSFIDALDRAREGRDIVLLFRVPAPKTLLGRLRYYLGLADLSLSGQERLAPLLESGLSGFQIVYLPRGDKALQKAAERLEIDVVGPLTKPSGPALKTPWFAYLYDFQHKYLKALFSSEECAARDQRFGEILSAAPSVVVNAVEVKRDVERFFPGMEHKVVPLSFSAAPKKEWFDTDILEAQTRYSTGSRYFLVSNQFWLHKNHETVIEAFAAFSAAHPDVSLVFTGDTFDTRSPTRLQDIEAFIAKLGIAEKVHILGLIPKIDQIALMRGCISVIQATSFEGGPGGGSVFDAIALDVRTIVSDIAINREIEPMVSLYFALNNVSELAAKMNDALNLPTPRADPSALVTAGFERRNSHGKDIWTAIEMAMRNT